MEDNQLAAYRSQLNQLQERLQSDIQSRVEVIPEKIQAPGDISREPTHPADRDVEGLAAETAMGAVQSQELDAVNAALERIEAGSYGACVDCGTEISQQRLQAIPFTPYCIDCERRRESAEAE